MEEKTDFVTRSSSDEQSRLWNVSVRGWLAICIIGTVCVCTVAVVLGAVSVAIYTGSLAVLANDSVTTMFRGAMELALIALGYYCGRNEREHISRPRKADGTKPDFPAV